MEQVMKIKILVDEMLRTVYSLVEAREERG